MLRVYVGHGVSIRRMRRSSSSASSFLSTSGSSCCVTLSSWLLERVIRCSEYLLPPSGMLRGSWVSLLRDHPAGISRVPTHAPERLDAIAVHRGFVGCISEDPDREAQEEVACEPFDVCAIVPFVHAVVAVHGDAILEEVRVCDALDVGKVHVVHHGHVGVWLQGVAFERVGPFLGRAPRNVHLLLVTELRGDGPCFSVRGGVVQAHALFGARLRIPQSLEYVTGEEFARRVFHVRLLCFVYGLYGALKEGDFADPTVNEAMCGSPVLERSRCIWKPKPTMAMSTSSLWGLIFCHACPELGL
eukprot:712431-Rhodomonas_salina.1